MNKKIKISYLEYKIKNNFNNNEDFYFRNYFTKNIYLYLDKKISF
jgi:hypothetical protein